MNINSLATLLASSHVLRCHTLPCLNRPTVGHHTFRTLVILHWIYSPLLPPATLSYFMLIHDMAEVYTGDMPGHVKADNRQVSKVFNDLEVEFENTHNLVISSLTTNEIALLAFCDRADLTWYALDEIDMGNRNMQPVAKKAFGMMADQFEILCLQPIPEYISRVRKLISDLNKRLEGSYK